MLLFRPTARSLPHSLATSRPLFLRYTSKETPQTSNAPIEPPRRSFPRHTEAPLHILKRLVKYSLIGLCAVGFTTFAAFEGVHLWVEKVELSPEDDEETRKWEWDRDPAIWSTTGTDPTLGIIGRHAVRSAWIAQNWGTGAGLTANTYRSRRGVEVVDSNLEYAQNFLRVAISAAEQKLSSDANALRPSTFPELLSRHASVLERMGSQNELFESRAQYERAWGGLPGKGADSAHVALKLGDLNRRLGDNEEALAWWTRAIQLAGGGVMGKFQLINLVPESLPSSPLLQRTLTSALVSLSAFFATAGLLNEAQTIQEASLKLLRSIRPLESPQSTSPPQNLHDLYITLRCALISIHLAEVLFAQNKTTEVSMPWLTYAALSSERVIFALTNSSSGNTDANIHYPPSKSSLLPVYIKSRSMNKPATNLLRNAKRSVAVSWNLLGELNEKASGTNSEKVLECYERAVRWAGVEDETGRNWRPREEIVESDWKVIWDNYVRARDAVHNKVAKP
jgi:tetratricopeptide (TPR) repeat protein